MKRQHYIGVDNGLDGAAYHLNPDDPDGCVGIDFICRTALHGKGRIISYEPTKEKIEAFLIKTGAVDPDRSKAQTSRDTLVVLEEAITGKSFSSTVGTIASTWGSFTVLSNIFLELQEKYGFALLSLQPVKWQRSFWPLMKKKREDPKASNKKLSILHAQRLFPHLDFRRSERHRTAFDGYTDALLLAVHSERTGL